MKKHQAISYLKYLHALEMNYRSNLVTLEIATVIQNLRFEFIVAYREG